MLQYPEKFLTSDVGEKKHLMHDQALIMQTIEGVPSSLKEIHTLIRSGHQLSTQQNKALFAQNLTLQALVTKLQSVVTKLETDIEKQGRNLSALRQYQADVIAKENAKEEKRLKKRLMVTQEKRDRITPDEFYRLLEMAGGHNYNHQRSFVMFVLLYITGLRAGNLALVKVKHMQELLRDGETRLRIIKNGPERHQIKLSKDQRDLLTACDDKIRVLFRGKRLYDNAFTPMARPQGECGEWIFKITLNSFLKVLSEKTGKKISTHSFRVSMITDLLETLDIHTVRKIIGHKSIKSTSTYDRTRVCFDKVFKNLDETRKR